MSAWTLYSLANSKGTIPQEKTAYKNFRQNNRNGLIFKKNYRNG